MQLELPENSEEFSTASKKNLIIQKKINLEENRRFELIEENKLEIAKANPEPPSTASIRSNYKRDLHLLLLKTPQNLKLSNFDGSSCLDWHSFLLQYNSSTVKYYLTKKI